MTALPASVPLCWAVLQIPFTSKGARTPEMEIRAVFNSWSTQISFGYTKRKEFPYESSCLDLPSRARQNFPLVVCVYLPQGVIAVDFATISAISGAWGGENPDRYRNPP